MAHLIRLIAEQKPDEHALVDEFGETSWREFNLRVNRLVNKLREVGLKKGDVFAILSGNRREYFEAFAAACHGGWVLVPINWHLVASEVAYMLANSGAKVLLADERNAQLAEATVNHPDAPSLVAKIVMAGESVGFETSQFENYEVFLASAADLEPSDQMMGGPMFYTSGTTGKPKGVRGSITQVGAPVETMGFISTGLRDMLTIPPDGKTLLVGPVYHSAQWAFSFFPLIAGSAVIMRDKFDAAQTLALLDKYQITNTHLVPTQFVRMLRLPESIKESFKGDSLEVAWHGAAPCPPEVKRQMIDWWGPKVSEYYGSTEGSIVTTVNANEWLARPGTLGKPTAIMEIIVVKDDGKIAAPNESGQLYVKNLMGSDFEYHEDAEKTAKAHLEPGVFTFGDMGYLDKDGYLYMSDRKIDMIISGGVNIYPAEIEAVLMNHPSIVDAAVFGIPNEEFGEEVKAAVELVDGNDADELFAEEVILFCRKNLAGYKVPKSIDIMERLPRNPTGKLLKRLLRDPYWEDKERSI
jgi:long-chain acyl-CoA synthetase